MNSGVGTHYFIPPEVDLPEAACRGKGLPDRGEPWSENLWFSIELHDQYRARQICAECPERHRCLEIALGVPRAQDYGIWGGLTRDERHELRKQRARAQRRRLSA